MTKLKFAKGNAKLDKGTAVFSLPAGHTCPGASLCLSKVDLTSGKLTDGKACQFRCFAASAESLFRNIRVGRWNNYNALRGKSVAEMVELIERSMPRKGIKRVRIHASGDFFIQDYFDAWLIVARKNPSLVFYAYTKMLPFWVRRKDAIPANMKLVASYGGKFDAMIAQHGLRYARVVGANPAESPEKEAKRLGLPIDHDDSLAYSTDKSFALALHGTQPAGSLAGKAWHAIKTKGKGGYQTNYFDHYAKSGKMSKRYAAHLEARKAKREAREKLALAK